MLVLGLESTCDETACAIVKDGKEILANCVASQAELHSRYGGVVPELSCRQHATILVPLIEETLRQADVKLEQIELIAVAHAPGLIGALLIGLNAAKALSLALNIPMIGVNHVEAHLYAALMSHTPDPHYPCLGIVISGGHTALWRMDQLGSYELLGQTVDDAIGEAFDKVAKLMHLPYPGGPQIEKLARQGNPQRFALKGGRVKGRPLDFSFSGLKTAVLYTLQPPAASGKQSLVTTESDRSDLAASFQEAACCDIIDKAILAAKQHNLHTVVLGGGVTNNLHLRELFAKRAPHLHCLWPSAALSLDNAAMIAGLGYQRYLQRGNCGDTLTLPAYTRLPLVGA
jgi:N6-L-threonylcarbamoyladenine synthase